MGILRVLAVSFGLLCLVYLMTKVEESVEIRPQTQWKKTDELCDGFQRFILRPNYPFLLPFTNATEVTSLYTAFSFWLLQHGSFTWLKVIIKIFHLMFCLLITPVKKTTSALCGYHKVSAKNRHLDPFSVEKKSCYKSIFGRPLDVNYPNFSDSKLSNILPLVSRVPHKLKHLFTTPNLVPVNMIRWLFGGYTTYCTHMFKKKVTSNTWKVCVVVVQDECGAAVKSGLFDYEAVQQFKVTFDGDKILLKIRKEDHNMGWSITPENSLEITKESVDSYRGEGTMPCCWLNVKWKGGDNLELQQELCLEGTTGCSNVFQLMCSYEASPCAYVFKKKRTANTWMVNVVIIRDYAKCIKAVKEKFRDHDEAVLPFPVEFEKDAVVLKIRQKEYQNEILYPEGLDVDGWKITPDNYAEITKESVNRFPDGAIKPYCRLEVEWKGGNKSSELTKVVCLEGAKGRRNVFQLMCSYEASPCAFVFKKKCSDKTWMVNVVIVRDETESRDAVVSEFKGYEEAVRAFPVEFEEDAVVLKIRQKGSSSVDIPYPEGLDLKGWTVTSDSPLDITKESVKQFPGGAIKPWCELKVEWKGEGNSELKQVVCLEGAKGPRNVFQLKYSYEVSHCAYVFKEQRAANTWIMKVVVAQDDKECKDAVECKFQGHEVAVPPFPVKFEKDADMMVLKIRAREKGSPNVEIPYPEGLDVSGWHITPENPPDITRECVNRYPNGLMPHCQFKVKWNGADKDKLDLKRVMCLEGARGPRNIFSLTCSYKEIQSLCRVYGKRNAEGSRWMVNVVIFRDDKECKNALSGEFQDHEVAVEPFAVNFEGDTTVLKIRNGDGKNVDIPQPQGLDVDGWNITPTRHPEITKDCVNSYPDGGQKPWCQLKVKWKGGVNSELKKVVCLDGAKQPRNVFTLMCNYQGSTGPIPGTVVLDKKPHVYELSEVIKRTAANWSELAYALKFDNHDVDTIGRDNPTVKDGCTVMLGKWLDGQGKREPRTWCTLLEALKDIDLTELADELSPP